MNLSNWLPWGVTLLALHGLLLPSFAQETAPAPGTLAAAEELLEVSETEKLMNDSMEQMLDLQLQQMSRLGISAQGMADLKKEMLAFFAETMAWDTLKPQFIKLYAEAFTEAELKEILAFYKTPTGKKALQVTPQLMTEGMKIGQTAVQAKLPELEKRISPILQRELPQP